MTSEVPQALSGRLSFLLGRLYMRALDLEARRLEALGVTVKQQAVLALLADEGPMTQQHLGQRLGIDRTTVVTVVDGLEQARLVERRRSPADRRAYLLTLTPDGVRAGEQGRGLVSGAEGELLGALGEDERRTLAELLGRAVQGQGPGDAGASPR
ncbi:MarR family winged helix-turn-helix transcriptional regulator [Microbispora bryophytorum]|uniref:MarR family transcriptional regulator n=1 Tax=Microbispora bryophytorum subsp. camponoti TaxID=1677852 RepID=A0ABR8LCP3_9ACTN|nr:MarR family transcriptional regulator [Microbispora camponoti]MBD3147482.1 MarR family transcriptional regulator [Microbispora camponoti]